MAKEYKSWEILKMIQEHKLNPGDIILSDNQIDFKINNDRCLLYNKSCREEMPSSYLKPEHTFTIKEKEVSFIEAVNSGKAIKPITWDNYYLLDKICEKLAGNLCSDVRVLINGLWNIKMED